VEPRNSEIFKGTLDLIRFPHRAYTKMTINSKVPKGNIVFIFDLTIEILACCGK